VIRRLFKPRTALPMGLALGLLVLWELGAVPVPFDADAGPIARAGIAVGLAVFGAVVGFLLQLAVSKLLPSSKGNAPDEGDG